ncbi:MAG: Type I secretion membrane fusion protein, HlyD family, partial [uncultured bacterium]
MAKNETDKSVAAGSADRHLTQLHNSRYKAELDQVTDIRTTILVQSPRGGQLIVWMTLVLTFLLIYWMYVSQIEEITRGTGKVIPSSQLQVVQNLEGGILAETLVREGEVVTKGQLLMRLDETRFSAPYQESRLKYLSLLAKSARLRAENEGGSMQVPEEVVKERPEIAAREQQLFVARKNKLITTIAILEEQEIQRKQELAELEDKLRELDRTYKLLKKEIDMTKPLVAQGAVSEVEILRLDREASTMQGEMSGIRQSIPRTKSKITEARKVIDEERMNFANTAKKELNEVQVELEGLSASATALADRLDRTSVRSPVHGTV